MSEVKIKISADDAASRVLSQVRANMGQLQASATALTSALGLIGGVSLGGLAVMTKSVVDGIDAMNDLKDATGASIENISALEDVALRTGGTFDTVQTSLIKFNQVLNSAEGGSKTAKALEAIGLSAEALKAVDPAEALRQTAVALAGFADDGNKARLTQDLFGKSTKEVAAFLKDLAEQGKLVGTVTTEQAQAAEDFNKQLSALSKNAKDAGRSLLSEFVPALNEVLDTYNRGGLSAAIDGIGNKLFDWEGSQSRKIIKNIENDLASLNEQSSLITIDLFGKKGALALEIEAKTKELEKARSLYLKLTDGSAGGGRGNVNPANVDVRNSVRDSGGKDKPPGAKGTDPDADFKNYLDNLQKQIEKTQNLTAVEQLLVDIGAKRLTVSAGQQQELENAAKRIDAIKAEAVAQTALEEARKSSAKYIEDLVREQAAMEQSNQALREQIEEIGLSKTALADLQTARIDATIALEQDTLAMLAHNNGSEAEVALQERKIALLREQRELTNAGQIRQAAADTRADQDRASKEFAATLNNDLKSAFSAAFRDTGGDPLKAFGDALENVVFTRAATALADALAEAALQQVGTSALGSGGGGIGDFFSNLFSFDGGGSTGSGPRSGGLDGKGGFMAMLHPQETVVDHTKGQSAGGAVVINQTVHIDSRSDQATIMAAMHRAKEMAKAEILQSRARGGAFA